MQQEKTIGDLIRKIQNNYINGTTTISEHVVFNQYENLNRIEAYAYSKHISGDTDSKGRAKPFFNIVTAAINIWYRATDIDRKDIRIKATRKKDTIAAFLATLHLQAWMKKDEFGSFLNEWGRSLAKYGSVVAKFVDKGSELHAQVVPWMRFICDPIDFENNPKIERLYLTPAQLRTRDGYDKKEVEALLEALKSRETLNGQNRDNKNDFVELYEIHGNLPLSYLTDNEDDEEIYRQQMHVVSFVASKNKGEFDDYTLVKGKETKDPYMITHLIKEDGRTQSIGAVEHLFEAQWMNNHSMKAIKDQLDLASKLIFQTSDGSFVGRNALTHIESGDIMIHELNQPLTQINNDSHDVTSLQAFAQEWRHQGQEITGTPDILQGKNMPSGTAFRQAAIIQQESHSLFEMMIENKGLALEKMMRTYVIPYLKRKMETTKEIASTLEANDIAQLDSMFVPNEVIRRSNQEILNSALNGRIEQTIDPQAEQQKIQQELSQLGNQRFIKPSDIESKTWKEVFKDLEWEVQIEITNEESDKDTVLTTLTSVLQTIASNPAVLQDPNMKLIFAKILDASGTISPLELSQAQQSIPQPALQPPNIGGAQVGVTPNQSTQINAQIPVSK